MYSTPQCGPRGSIHCIIRRRDFPSCAAVLFISDIFCVALRRCTPSWIYSNACFFNNPNHVQQSATSVPLTSIYYRFSRVRSNLPQHFGASYNVPSIPLGGNFSNKIFTECVNNIIRILQYGNIYCVLNDCILY